jgi:hypothetical protein
MGMTMGNPTCEWVRACLPLWVGDNDDAIQRTSDEGDLGLEDRRSVERHLGACPSCRQHQAALEQSLSALASAAACLPIPPDAPSLWPVLERRIAAHDARTRSRWIRAMRGVVDRGLRAWAALGGEQTLRLAWVSDNLGEALGCRERSVREHRRRPGLVLGFSLGAAALILLIGLPVVRRQQAEAQAIISANAGPLERPVLLPAPPDEEAPATSDLVDTDDVPANQVAQTEPVQPPEAPAPGLDGTPTLKAAAPTRFGYDLEHGIPMPPDSRDSKLVY